MVKEYRITLGLSTYFIKILRLFLVVAFVADMPNETCKHGKSAPSKVVDDLPVYQGSAARHKCPICAYEKGFEDGLKSKPPTIPPGSTTIMPPLHGFKG
jgi:hypothetical protein